MFATLVCLLLISGDDSSQLRWIVSTVDGKKKLTEEAAPAPRSIVSPDGESSSVGEGVSRIVLRPERTFQTMIGMGSSLEPTTCQNLARLTPEERDRVLVSLMSPTEGIGFSLVRICMGTPDFTGDPWYSYNDLPEGETDPELKHFSIEKDRAVILPAIQAARRANPEALFFASPWSPPGWMKTTGSMIGGELKPEWDAVYAQYFVRFIQAYEAEGIPIHAVTVQNEPGVDRAKGPASWHYPSCRWTGERERDFIRDHLGPALRQAGLQTRIWCYDHNYNVRPTGDGDDPGLDYPRTILSDPKAAAFVDAVALHGYAGRPENMTILHDEFPHVPIVFTEGSVFGISGAYQLTNLLRNWAAGYNGWVTMIDTNGKPNNGPFRASKTMLLMDAETAEIDYRFDYFMLGQFTKFIPPGSVRIESGAPTATVKHVAFQRPDGTTVVVASTSAFRPQKVTIEREARAVDLELPARSVSTLLWPPESK